MTPIVIFFIIINRRYISCPFSRNKRYRGIEDMAPIAILGNSISATNSIGSYAGSYRSLQQSVIALHLL